MHQPVDWRSHKMFHTTDRPNAAIDGSARRWNAHFPICYRIIQSRSGVTFLEYWWRSGWMAFLARHRDNTYPGLGKNQTSTLGSIGKKSCEITKKQWRTKINRLSSSEASWICYPERRKTLPEDAQLCNQSKKHSCIRNIHCSHSQLRSQVLLWVAQYNPHSSVHWKLREEKKHRNISAGEIHKHVSRWRSPSILRTARSTSETYRCNRADEIATYLLLQMSTLSTADADLWLVDRQKALRSTNKKVSYRRQKVCI